MSIRETLGMIWRKSPDVPDCIEGELRAHPCSPLVLRENWGPGSDAYSNAGWDISYWGEPTDGPDVTDTLPECTCARDSIRSGARRIKGPDGQAQIYIEPAPRTWQEATSFTLIQGTAQGNETQFPTVLIGQVDQKVQAGCYPLVVRPRLEVCDVRIESDDIGPWEVNADWQVNDNDDSPLTIGSCVAARGWGGSYNANLKDVLIPQGECRTFTAEFNLRSAGPSTADASVVTGFGRWCIDIYEQTSLEPINNGSPC